MSEEIDEVLKILSKEDFISMSKADSVNRKHAINKLNAFKLIEHHSQISWRLTSEGHKAAELGGFNAWQKKNERKKRIKSIALYLTIFSAIVSILISILG